MNRELIVYRNLESYFPNIKQQTVYRTEYDMFTLWTQWLESDCCVIMEEHEDEMDLVMIDWMRTKRIR